MRIRSVFGILAFIVLGCSTTHQSAFPPKAELMPPEMAGWPINQQLFADKDSVSIDIFLNRVAQENPSPSTLWWVNYRRAQLWRKKDPNVACEKFSQLANEPLFPLRREAYLNAHSICEKNYPALSRLEIFDLQNFEPWLNDIAAHVAIEKAKAEDDYASLVQLFLQKSKLNLRKEEKVQYAHSALIYAKKMHDKNSIQEIENRLHSLSPSLKSSSSGKDYLAIANDYRYLRNFNAARKYYDKVVKSSESSSVEKILALRGIRYAYKIQQKRENTVTATENLARFVTKLYGQSKKSSSDAKLLLDTQLLLARTYWTEDRNKDALKTLAITEKTIGKKASLSELYWIRGRMEEEKNDFKESTKWFRRALNETIENESFRKKILWYLAWNERKQNNYLEAISILSDLKERSDNDYELSRISFWLAKTFKDDGKNDESLDEYKELIKEDPASYYGLLAHREINIPLPTRTIRKLEDKKSLFKMSLSRKIKEHLDENYLEWLVATNETKIANMYLDKIAADLRKKKENDIDTWVSLLHLYAKSQNYLSLFTQLSFLESAFRRQIIQENPHIVFPSPYFETVSQSASRFGLSVEFIYSIMRQESSFNPQARSQMDAFGLMQLLPEVAKKAASANSIVFSQEEDLYEPHINIPIGSAHLRELWDKYNGEIVLAVASYNASENAILTWLKTRYRGDTLEFIEDIPYDETRDYVKLVMRNLVTYKILNSTQENLVFPEWTLRISYQTP